MSHTRIWVKSLFTTLFVAILIFFPVMMVSDSIEIADFYLILPIVLIIGTPVMAWMNYGSEKRKKHKHHND